MKHSAVLCCSVMISMHLSMQVPWRFDVASEKVSLSDDRTDRSNESSIAIVFQIEGQNTLCCATEQVESQER